jgi:hypothetical protein
MEILPGQIITFRLTDAKLAPGQTIKTKVRAVYQHNETTKVYLDADEVDLPGLPDTGEGFTLTKRVYIYMCPDLSEGLMGDFRDPDSNWVYADFDIEIQEVA